MEAYPSSVLVLPIDVGGVVGRITAPGAGRFIGGCAGWIRLSQAQLRPVGGCVGQVSQPGPRRFVGGCAGVVQATTSHAQRSGRLSTRAHRESRILWGEEALGEVGL